ncbi:MAG TPA: flagellar basal body rod protein FlgC [Polyangiaceae bacterium]|jgi:flagellar basal-body rod protein FlgC|nr:flagellar basal body rod protein FlgC [Polyangiaceae bacterium]
MLGVFSAIDIAASGLSAQRTRMNTIASNLANAETTRTSAGGPYKRVDPVFQAVALDKIHALTPSEQSVSMVQVSQIAQDKRPGHLVYSPGHPDANKDGYLEYPNVNVVEEMTNMISASRAYEAGIATVEATERMGSSALELGRG